MSTGKKLIRFIGGLTVPNGRYAGRPLVVLPFQRRFLRGAFGQPDDAALSLARGGGKTTLNAAILAATLDGPLVQPRAESVLVASSFEQALIGFRVVLAFLEPRIAEDPRRWRIQDSVNRASITDRTTGATVRVLGSDPRRAHGLQANLLLLDECAQWPPTQVDAMVAALETSRGKIPGSRMLWTGTRSASAQHPFSSALDGGVGYSQIHAARPDDPPFQRRTWKRANPGLDHFPDLEATIRREARKARADPSRLAAFRALRLNMGGRGHNRGFTTSRRRMGPYRGGRGRRRALDSRARLGGECRAVGGGGVLAGNGAASTPSRYSRPARTLPNVGSRTASARCMSNAPGVVS